MMSKLYQLYLGDCTSEVKKHIEDNSVDLIITDPPYGISGDKLDKHYHRKESTVIDGYVDIPKSEYFQFSINWIKEAERVLRPGGSMYIISGYSNLIDILNVLNQTKLKEINHIIWKYNFGVYTTKKYVSSHYHILYYVKPGGKVTFNTHSRFGPQEKGDNGGSLNYRDREDVWIINREYKPGEVKNKNELPNELLIKMMQYSSNENDLVADFFLGGFSTAKVALGLNRKIVGFEINENSFNHHYPEMEKIKTGYLLKSIKTGVDDSPANQGKPWSEQEILELRKRFSQTYKTTQSKKISIEILQKEFGRGYFSILNKLDEIFRNE